MRERTVFMKKPLFVVATTILTLVASFVPMASANAADPVCTINVTESNTTVQGTNLGDVICITGDNNIVNALGGDDTVIDDGTDNTINLGEGFDIYDGSGGDGSTVDGGSGDDEITGTPGDDELSGGDGDDTLIGGEEDDTLNGGLGADELSGNAGDDHLFGESGSDNLSGGDGDDILAGGLNVDEIAGGAGLNSCDYSSGETLTQSCIYDDLGPILVDLNSPASIDTGLSAVVASIQIHFQDPSGIGDYIAIGCNGAGDQIRLDIGNPSISRGTLWVVDPSSTPTDFRATANLEFPIGYKPGLAHCFWHVRDSLRNMSDGSFNMAVLRTPAGQPSDPQNLAYVPDKPTSGSLTWSSPNFGGDPAVYAYVTEYSLDGTSWVDVPNGATTATSLTFTKLKANTDYWFRVRGENGGTIAQDTTYMNLNWATTKIRTPAAVVSDAPTSILVSNLNSNGYKLAWSAPAYNGGAAITDFKVELSSDGGNTWRLAKQSASTSLSLNVSGAAPGTNYLVRVAAINAAGISEYLTGSLRTASSSPTSPRTISSSKITGTSLSLAWLLPSSNGGSAITDYKVEVSSNCSTYTKINRATSANLGFKVTGLKPGTKYCFRVSAGNALGYSLPTNAFEVVTQGYAPAAPTSLSVKAAKTSVTLGWKAAAVTGGSAVRNYIVEYSKDNGVSWLKVTKPVSTSRSLTIKGLRSRTTYLFRVTAVNDVGNSKASKSLKVTTG